MPLPILLLRKRNLRHSLGRPSRSDFVQLEVGKMLYAKKDGKWICTSIVSIQLNDKDVAQVDNGEVGIVTDIELEKGYEIFVKIE